MFSLYCVLYDMCKNYWISLSGSDSFKVRGWHIQNWLMFKVCCTTLGHDPVCFQYVQHVVLSRGSRCHAKWNVLVTDKDCPHIVTRAEWGARPPRKVWLIKEPIPKIFIHHTETPSCITKEACSKLVRSIQNFHMDTRGCVVEFIDFCSACLLEANCEILLVYLFVRLSFIFIHIFV